MENNIKKIAISFFVLFSILFLTSCRGGQNSGDSNRSGDGGMTEGSDRNTVVWGVRDDARIQEENVQRTNQRLSEKGYDLAIEIRYLKADRDYQKQEIYHNALAEAVKAGEVDIAYCDLWYDTAPGEMPKYLQSGLFYSLTEWLHSTDGAPVYELYDEDVWKGSSVGGENYILPDENCYDSPSAVIAFQRDHVSDKLINSWDGSWGDLWRIMEQIKLPKGDAMLLGYPEMSFFEGMVKRKKYVIEIDDELVYNIQTGKVYQPFELEEFHEYLSFLHQCYQKGYLTEEHGIDSGFINQEEIERQEREEYAISWQADTRLKNANVSFKKSSFSVTGILGGGTAVSAYSQKKEKALELLRILRTDDEIANTLVWGQGDASKLLGEDGYVKKSHGDSSNQNVFGLNDGIFQSEEDLQPDLNMREYRKKCMESPLRTSSRLLGFWPDYSSVEGELAEYKKVLAESIDCWQEKDFEKAYRKAEQRVGTASNKLIKELNCQIRDWKENEG